MNSYGNQYMFCFWKNCAAGAFASYFFTAGCVVGLTVLKLHEILSHECHLFAPY